MDIQKLYSRKPFHQVTSMNMLLIYTFCLEFYCIRLDRFLVFRILAFEIVYHSFVNRRMASNDQSQGNGTLHVQSKLLLRSIFLRAIRIIPSEENQVREFLDDNVDKALRPHNFVRNRS